MDADLIPEFVLTAAGSSKLNPSLDTMTCQYCGTEHVIRRSVFWCDTRSLRPMPIVQAKRSAEKVSAILNKQVSQSQRMETRQQVYTDSKGRAHTRTVEVPVVTTQTSNLAQRLAAPPRQLRRRRLHSARCCSLEPLCCAL